MNTNRRPLLIVVAVVLAAAAGLFAWDYLTQPRQAPPAPRSVVIASRAIAAREPIDPSMITIQTIPADQVQPGSYSAATALGGDVALVAIPAGSPLTASNVGHASQLETAVHLGRGMRAMSIPVDEVKDVAGLVQPGDHVDVYAIVESRGTTPPQSLAILRNLRVLAVGTSTGAAGAPAAGAPQARTVTLEVTPLQAKTLSLADLNATLRLALRPPAEPTRSTQTDSFVLAAQSAPAQTGTPAEQEAAALAAIASKNNAPQQPQAQQQGSGSESNGTVEYIYGDKVSTNGNP
jgi:Flp pilus assembly protein CpaB